MTAPRTAAEATVSANGQRTLPVPAPALHPRIALRGVTKQWNRRKAPVLNGVELVLEPGRLVSIIGDNGVGKTTLLRIAAGLIFPDSGTVQVDGLDPRRDRRRYQQRVGFVSAGSSGLYARLSPAAHLDYWARLALLPPARRRTACAEAVARFQMDEFATRRVDRISMGQRQRVRLALAFLHQPTVLLLDEPWNSLDAEGLEVLVSALGDFAEKGGTAVCCSPTGEAIDGYANETYVLGSGGMEAQ
jgi:ABC-type multidrug transport system ATPase subunit